MTHFFIQLLCQKVFFIFIHYDNFYLLTSISCLSIYLYFDVGFFSAKAWHCWLQHFLPIPWSLLGHFHPWSTPSVFLGCWFDGGDREGNVSLNLVILFSCKFPTLLKDKCKTSLEPKWGLQIGKGSGIWESNITNIFRSPGLKRKQIQRLVRTFPV